MGEPVVANDEIEALQAEVLALRECLATVEGTASGVEAGLAYLATASVALAASLDVGATLVTLGNLAVPRLADWCAIHLCDSDGTAVLASVQHLDPVKAESVRELFTGDLGLAGVVGLDGAVRTGATAFRPRLGEELLAAAGSERADELGALRLGSSVVVPLTARGSRFGALTFVTEEGRHFGETELALAEELAWRAAIALDNARLHEASERAKARQAYQATLLRSQAEAALDGLVVVSPDHKMIESNRRFAEIWELPADLVEGGSAEDFFTWAADLVADPAAFLAVVGQADKDPGQPVRDEIRLRDGRVLDSYGAPLVDEAGESHGWAWYYRDVTDQKRWERVLLESGERFAALARTLQQSLLPPDLPAVPGLELAARYHPAGGGLEVGGDFYDVFQTGRQAWAFVMGDVCGKGAEAARTTGLARYTLRAGAMQAERPSDVLAMLNEALIRQQSENAEPDPRFITAAYASVRLFRRVRLTVALGGHPPPLLLHRDGSVEPLGDPGTALGLLRTPELHNREVTLSQGDLVVFYTDGVTEARSRATAEEFGEHRLRALLAGLAGSPAATVAAAVETAALDHQGGQATDDMAVLVFRVDPPS